MILEPLALAYGSGQAIRVRLIVMRTSIAPSHPPPSNGRAEFADSTISSCVACNDEACSAFAREAPTLGRDKERTRRSVNRHSHTQTATAQIHKIPINVLTMCFACSKDDLIGTAPGLCGVPGLEFRQYSPPRRLPSNPAW